MLLVSCNGLHMVAAFATCVGAGGTVTICVCVSTFVAVAVEVRVDGPEAEISGSGNESGAGEGANVDVSIEVEPDAFFAVLGAAVEVKDISVRALMLGRMLLSAILPEGGIFVNGSSATRNSGQFF